MIQNEQTAVEICTHIRTSTNPFEVELVLDEHLGFTDALVRCRRCGRAYLLEMLDWLGHMRLFRVGTPESRHSARLIKDLNNGSCDIRRSTEEIEQFKVSNPPGRALLLMNTTSGCIEGCVRVPEDIRIPGAGWRDLPCDGAWLDQIRRYTEIENG